MRRATTTTLHADKFSDKNEPTNDSNATDPLGVGLL
jgi:hypothetical protein